MGLPLLCGYLQIDKYYAELTFFCGNKARQGVKGVKLCLTA